MNEIPDTADDEPLDDSEEQLDGQFLLEEYSAYRRIGALLILGAMLLLILAGIISILAQSGA